MGCRNRCDDLSGRKWLIPGIYGRRSVPSSIITSKRWGAIDKRQVPHIFSFQFKKKVMHDRFFYRNKIAKFIKFRRWWRLMGQKELYLKILAVHLQPIKRHTCYVNRNPPGTHASHVSLLFSLRDILIFFVILYEWLINIICRFGVRIEILAVAAWLQYFNLLCASSIIRGKKAFH